METFLYGLAASAIAALTFIAYRHPVEFEKMGDKLSLLFFAIAGGMLMHKLGASEMYVAALKFTPEAQTTEFEEKAAAVISWTNWPIIGCCLIGGYCQFLTGLPLMLNLSKDDKDE